MLYFAIFDGLFASTYQLRMTNNTIPVVNLTGTLDMTNESRPGNMTDYFRIEDVNVIVKPQSGQPRLVIQWLDKEPIKKASVVNFKLTK